jgi:hypothetical protein
MTVPTDLRRCTGWFTCDSAGYDAGNARLIDQSGLGLHFPLVGPAPAFITRAGVDCIDLDNTFYFERYNLIPVHGSVVIKFHTDSTGSINSILPMLWWRQTAFSTGDHVALTPKVPWDLYDGRALSWFSPSGGFVRVGSFKASTLPACDSAPAALNTWHVVTGTWTTRMESRVKVDAAATVTKTVPSVPVVPPQYEEDTMRFGYLKVTGMPTFPPQHLSVAQFAFFHDDILANQPTEAAALVASWS